MVLRMSIALQHLVGEQEAVEAVLRAVTMILLKKTITIDPFEDQWLEFSDKTILKL